MHRVLGIFHTCTHTNAHTHTHTRSHTRSRSGHSLSFATLLIYRALFRALTCDF